MVVGGLGFINCNVMVSDISVQSLNFLLGFLDLFTGCDHVLTKFFRKVLGAVLGCGDSDSEKVLSCGFP